MFGVGVVCFILVQFLPIQCSCAYCKYFNLKKHFFGAMVDQFKTAADTLFILLGAIMILAMHAGFAFLELGTVRRKNQVNALVQILAD
jgi:hypothetical protein